MTGNQMTVATKDHKTTGKQEGASPRSWLFTKSSASCLLSCFSCGAQKDTRNTGQVDGKTTRELERL